MSYAWWVAKIELKHKWLSLLATFIMSMMIGYFTGSMLLLQLRFEEPMEFFGLFNVIDYVLIGILPFLGALFFSKEYLSLEVLMTNSAFLKRLQFYRMWAIPAEVIARSRMIYVLCCLAVSLSGFFITFIWASGAGYWEQWGAGYVAFIVVLVAYATALSGLNPLFEFSRLGKTILLGQLGFLAVIVSLLVLANHVTDQPLYYWIFTIGAGHPWLVALGAMAMAGMGIFIFERVLRERLRGKDFR